MELYVIPSSLRQITDSNRKLTDFFSVPNLVPNKQLWNIPVRRESLTWRSAQVKRVYALLNDFDVSVARSEYCHHVA